VNKNHTALSAAQRPGTAQGGYEQGNVPTQGPDDGSLLCPARGMCYWPGLVVVTRRDEATGGRSRDMLGISDKAFMRDDVKHHN
jgi:hypothetical protein